MSGQQGERRSARETALGWLYEADVLDVSPSAIVDGQLLEPDPFAAAVVRGVGEHAAMIDAMIASHAQGWDLDRMLLIDRAILRMGTFELMHRSDVPTGAVLNEAVELAKSYSTDDSSSFVNGVLAAVAAEVRT